MSEFDDYYGDDYDDEFDEEWIWIDDGDRELADDLAENTMHTPVFFDELALEALDNDSDWEYYTDEYYDYEPSIARKQGDTLTLGAQNLANNDPKFTRRKRKREKKDKSTGVKRQRPIDTSSFCGVVFRVLDNSPTNAELHEPGNGERVALLKNWREVFKDSQPKKSRNSSAAILSPSPSKPQVRKRDLRNVDNRKPVNNREHNRNGDAGCSTDLPNNGDDHTTEEANADLSNTRQTELTPPPYSISPSGPEVPEASKKNYNRSGRSRRTGSKLKEVVSVQDLSEENLDLPNSIEQGGLLATTSSNPPHSHPIQDTTMPKMAHLSPETDTPGPSTRKRKAASVEDAGESNSNTVPNGNKRGKSIKSSTTEDKEKHPVLVSSETSTSRTRRSLRERK